MFDWDDILIIGDSYVSARDKEFNWPMSLALQLTGLAFNKDRLPRGIGYPGCAWWSVRNELLKQLSIKIPKVLILCHPDKNRYISDENLPFNIGSAMGKSMIRIDSGTINALHLYYKHLYSSDFHAWTEKSWFIELDEILNKYQIPYIIHLHCNMLERSQLHEFKNGITHSKELFDPNNINDYDNHLSTEENVMMAKLLFNLITTLKPFAIGMQDYNLTFYKKEKSWI